MTQIANLKEFIENKEYADILVRQKDTEFTIPMAEGPYKILGNWLLINLIMWTPFIRRGVPITKDYLLIDEDITGDSLQRVHNNMWNDIEFSGQDDIDMFKEELASCHNESFNIAFTDLGSYHTSISKLSIEQSLENIELLRATYINFKEGESILEVEKRIDARADNIWNVFSDPAHKAINVLYPYVRLKVASKNQVPQVLLAAGTRTDVNDSMVHMPIEGSYFRGLNNSLEAAVDALSAKKSIGYNKANLPKSQYTNRRAQILASIIKHLHPGDCGSKLTTPLLLTDRVIPHVFGMNIYSHGQIVELSTRNIEDFRNKVVHLRSPITCAHTDGVCEACSGRLAINMHPNMIIGHSSIIEMISPIGQLLLSNKHFSKTLTVAYDIPEVCDRVFMVKKDKIYVRDKMSEHQDHLYISVPFTCFARIADLSVVDDEAQINDADFSNIKMLAVLDDRLDENPIPPTVMEDKNKTTPYFTSDFLMYVKENDDLVTIGETEILISLERWDIEDPIMGYVMENASMPRFVNRVTELFMKDIQEYTSAEKALRDFTNIIYTKVSPHIYHICVALRACMVISNNDFRIPVVKDINDVKFMPLLHAIPQRSTGGQFAFERMVKHLGDPRTFTVPKIGGIFDPYIGMMSSDRT